MLKHKPERLRHNPPKHPDGRPWTLIVGLAVMLGGALTVAAVRSQTPKGFGVVPPPAAEATRQIDAKIRKVGKTGKSLLDVLLPTDVVLEVVDWQPAGSPPMPPEGHSALEMLTIERPLVAVVTVESTVGALSPDGGWVETIVTARVNELPKNADGELNLLDGQLTFATPGGELSLGKQTIRAVRPGNLAYEVGRQYVVFLQRQGERWYAQSDEVALIEGQSIKPLSRDGEFRFRKLDRARLVSDVAANALVRK